VLKAIATSPSVWTGIVVIPSSKAYEPNKEIEQIEDARDDETAATMSTIEAIENGAGQSESTEPKMEIN